MLAGFLKKKAVNATKSQHVMSGISRVGSNMLTLTYYHLMKGGPMKHKEIRKPPLQPTGTWRSIAALGFLS